MAMEHTIIPSDKKGGRKTPAAAGLTLEHRDTLWERLQARPEGSLFKTEDIIGDDKHMGDDFAAMRNHDYVHVNDGWLTAVKEGAHVRGLPNPRKVAQDWLNRFDHHDTVVEFGDWTAWRVGLFPWEPIAGYRFRTKTPQATSVLFLGHMKIRVVHGPDWLRDDSKQGQLFRALHDMPHKTFGLNIHTWAKGEEGLKKLKALRPYAIEHDAAWEEWEDEETKGIKPSSLIDMALQAVHVENERRKR